MDSFIWGSNMTCFYIMWYFVGGTDYVQVFSSINPIKSSLGRYQLSRNKTNILMDGDTTTCIPLFRTGEVNYVQMKILVRRENMFKRIFNMDVTANSWFICSPTEGIHGFVHAADKQWLCVVLKGNIQGGRRTCRFRCDGRNGLDFVLLQVKRVNDRNTDLKQVCEIKMN